MPVAALAVNPPRAPSLGFRNCVSKTSPTRKRGKFVVRPSLARRACVVGCAIRARAIPFWMCLVAMTWMLGCDSAPPAEAPPKPRELKTSAERLSVVRFSPDGNRLAAGSVTGEVFVWNDLQAEPRRLDSRRTSPLLSMSWSPDELLVTTDMERGLIGWQFGSSEPERVELPGLATPAVCIAFRPAVQHLELVLGLRDGSLIFLDQKGSKQLKPDHRGPVKQVMYSRDGRWLITAGADGKLIWRDAASRNVASSVKAHDAEISQVLFSADGQLLVSADWNGQIKVWDATSRMTLKTFEQAEAVSGLGWLYPQLVSSAWDGRLRVWSFDSGTCVRIIATGQPIHGLTIDPHTQRIATVGLDRGVRLWDLTDERH